MSAAPELYAGVVGRIVAAYAAHTEADPVAIATQFVVAFGSAVGPGPHMYVGETQHHTNENLCLVGQSSRARKGDSGRIALRALRDADPDWTHCVASGLSSGEGLIHHVRDATYRETKDGERVISDAGADDKRLCVLETEFSTALKQFRRDGNVLSNVLRDAWDAKDVLRTLTKQSPTRATGAHVSVIAHSTPADLARYLADTEAANGLANRFMFVTVHRQRLLPEPGRPPAEAVARLAEVVAQLLDGARRVGEMRRTPAGAELWRRIYPRLTADQPGLLGQLLARSEAHVTRLSMLYALLDAASTIDVPHIDSALAYWDVVEKSTRTIFAGRTGNRVADRLRVGMLSGESMTVEEIRRAVFSGHVTAAELIDALALLRDLGEVVMSTEPTGGRPSLVVTRTGGTADRTTADSQEAAA